MIRRAVWLYLVYACCRIAYRDPLQCAGAIVGVVLIGIVFDAVFLEDSHQ